ncbi:MAG: hypothetical protein M3Q80_02365 [bacterium]|nr:hypothetical protein [bacterium]
MENSSQKPPQYLLDIISSQEIFDAMEKIEKTVELHVDQTGELYVLISAIILGQETSANFIKEVMKRLEVDEIMANKIALETNKNIFDVVKSKLQAQNNESEAKATVASIEQLGGFNVEKPTATEESDVKTEDRSQILNSLENPPKNPDHAFSEPLVDHLLQNSSAQTETKIATEPKPADAPAKNDIEAIKNIIKAPEVPKAPEIKKGPDPYRESI